MREMGEEEDRPPTQKQPQGRKANRRRKETAREQHTRNGQTKIGVTVCVQVVGARCGRARKTAALRRRSEKIL
jgi:hypothetical protein